MDICSTPDFYRLQGHSLFHHGLPHRLQGNCCSGAWITSALSFFNDLGVCRAVSLMHSLAAGFLQFPTLNFIISGVTTITDRLGLGQEGSSWSQLVLTHSDVGGRFYQILIEATLVDPANKTCHVNPTQHFTIT